MGFRNEDTPGEDSNCIITIVLKSLMNLLESFKSGFRQKFLGLSFIIMFAAAIGMFLDKANHGAVLCEVACIRCGSKSRASVIRTIQQPGGAIELA